MSCHTLYLPSRHGNIKPKYFLAETVCQNLTPRGCMHHVLDIPIVINNIYLYLVPTDGAWSEWSPWSCGSSCGVSGVKLRSRTCINPQPLNGGKDCAGESYEVIEETCDTGSVCPCTDTGLLDCPMYPFICHDPSHENNYGLARAHCKEFCEFCPFGEYYQLHSILDICKSPNHMYVNEKAFHVWTRY